MRGNRPSAVVSLLLLAPPLLQAQPATTTEAHLEHSHIVDRWSIADGLPGTVTDVTETFDGDLWLGTVAGFVRFDGESFDIYDRSRLPDLPRNRVMALAAGRDSSLWMFIDEGLIVRWSAGEISDRIDLGSGGFLRPAPRSGGLDSDDFWAWRPGVVYHVRGAEWERVTFAEIFGVAGGEEDRITDVRQSRTGEVWVASTVGLARRVDGSWKVEAGRTGLPPGQPGALLEDSEGRIWVATTGGVGVRVHDEAFEVAAVVEDSPGPPLKMAEGKDGSLWVLYSNRLMHLRVIETGRFTRLAPLEARAVEASETTPIHADRMDNLWIGNLDGSLTGITTTTARHLGIGRGGQQLGVHHVIGDGSGGVWLGPGCHGVLHWDGSVLHRYEGRAMGLRSDCVQGLMIDSRGALWIGESESVVRHAGGKVQVWSWSDGEESVPINPLMEDALGRVWIGAGDKVLRIEADGSLEELGADLDLPTTDVWSLAQTPDGAVWVGQVGTVSRWNGEAFETFGESEGLPLDEIRALHASDDGSLWVGSYGGGIARFRDGIFTRITRANGLFDNSISAILEDDRQRLWLLGNTGVFTAPRAAFDSVADGVSATLAGVTFGPRDGVGEGNGGAPAAWLDASGTAWFATVDGLASLDVSSFPYDTTGPGVHIEEVTASRGEIVGGDPLVVPSGAGAVTVRYGAPGLPGGRDIHYRYRMLGLDPHWEDAGSGRVARFASLPPGRYEFQVLARNVDGVWSETPASVRLRVAYAWWQLPIVRAGAVLVAAILVVAYVRRRIHAAEQRSRRLLREIHEREAAEDRARRRQRELEHMSRVATAGELASSLAHELNQPLTAIVANAVMSSQMLSDPGVGKETIREALDDIAGDSRRAAEIIRELRRFIGRRQLDRAELDLNELVGEVVPIFRRELEDHGIELDLALSPDLPPVEGDRVQLQQVLVNLALNAVEALKAEPPDRRTLEIETRRAEGAARVAVTDNGPGIAEADLERVFDPFFSTKETGMGMGLAICSTIALAHGGKLTVKRNPDRGVTFELSLPTGPAKERKRISIKSSRGDGLVSTRGTVFIVDDDDSARTSFERILLRAGFEVATFPSASELLAEPRRFEPGCLLLDVRMPGMDGLALQEELRRDGCVKPIVFLTGYGNVLASVKAMKGGAVDFLEKPIEPDRLIEVVEEALERDDAERERLRERALFRDRLSTLTPREREVYEAVVAGRLNKQIARELGIALRTVKFHRAGLMRKLKVDTLTELIRLSESGGLDPAS